MAEITRKTGSFPIFSSTDTTQLRIFGGTTPSTDIDALVDTVEFAKGWRYLLGINQAPESDFNAVGYSFSKVLAYLLQKGIPEWSGTDGVIGGEDYIANKSWVQYNGKIYRAILNSGGAAIARVPTDTTYWVEPYLGLAPNYTAIKASNLASASTVNIGAATGDFIHITGITTITAFDTAVAGVERTLVFEGALTITHNATNMILPRGVDITTVANDVLMFRSEGGGNWRCVAGTALGASTAVPLIITTAATSIAGSSFIANGQITDFKNACNPETTQVRFSYGTDTNASNIGVTAWVSKTDITAFSTTISGLTPATTYYFKAQLQDTTYPSLNGTGTVTGDIELVLTASESIGTTINITGASSGGGFTALDATSYPTLTNASIVSNVIVASADSATATTYEFNQNGTSEVTPTVDLTPRVLTAGGTASVPVLTSSVGGLFTTGDTVYIDDNVSVKAAVCGTVTQTGGTLLSLAGAITNPYGITTDGTDLYVAADEGGGDFIYKITTAGTKTLFATLPSAAGNIRGLCRDASGDFYASRGDSIYKITSAGSVSSYQDSGTGLGDIYGMKIGLDGYLYACDYAGGRVLKITAAGSINVSNFITGLVGVSDLAQDSSGYWYVAIFGTQSVYKYSSSGVGIGYRNLSPTTITGVFITSDNLYVTSATNITRVNGVSSKEWTSGTAITSETLVTGLSTAKTSVLLSNTLYITETGASRVSKYTLDYTYEINGTTPALAATPIWAGVDEQTLEFGIGATSGSEVYTTMVNPTITRATNKLTLAYPAYDTSGNYFKFRHTLKNTDAMSRLYATTKYI